MIIDGYDNSMASLEATEEAANKMAAELNAMRGKRLNIVLSITRAPLGA